jgi:hypothetical protein
VDPFCFAETSGPTAPFAGEPALVKAFQQRAPSSDSAPFSELAALSHPRIVVLDATFAHHSWSFAPQVLSCVLCSPLYLHSAVLLDTAVTLSHQREAAAALAESVSKSGPPVVLVSDMCETHSSTKQLHFLCCLRRLHPVQARA